MDTSLAVSRPMKTEWNSTLSQWMPVGLAFAVYLVLAFPLRHWMVDDAAISMAYAANWVRGYGLVSQPGMAPVEGYSNFLWVAFLAGLNVLGLATVVGVKALSAVCVAAALLSMNALCNTLMGDKARAGVLLLSATCSSLVIWTTSGLENPLSLLLACEILRAMFLRRGVYLGALIAALGMTRPEGILVGVLPLAFLPRRSVLIYLAVVFTGFFSFLAFRWATFGDIVPNTFYAKEASRVDPLMILFNISDLLNAPFGLGLALLGILAVAPRVESMRRNIPLAMMAITGGIFALMPSDWMADHRFGTAFLPGAFVLTGVVLSKYPRVMLVLLVLSISLNAQRLATFYRAPTISTVQVEATANSFEQRAKSLGIKNASLLTPDIGAALLHSSLRIYDLAGLCDPVIATALRERDKTVLHDYVFEQLRPTFIHAHTVWADLAAFETDHRFARDYVALSATDFVRRDALRPSFTTPSPSG